MTRDKIAASTLAAVVAVSGIGGILVARHTPGAVEAVELSGDGAPTPTTDPIEPAIRRDEDDNVLEIQETPDPDPTGDGTDTNGVADTATGDGDSTAGDDGTSGGNNTGDGDNTRGNDGTSGGDNTGDGDRTRGDDGTSGGDNTASVDSATATGDSTDD
jgi:hypothetical protein